MRERPNIGHDPLSKLASRCPGNVRSIPLITGKPLVLQLRNRVFKIVVRPRSVRLLQREVSNSQSAAGWPGYGAHAHRLRSIAPGVAASLRLFPLPDKQQAIERLLAICDTSHPMVISAERKPAQEVIERFAAELFVSTQLSSSRLVADLFDWLHRGFFDYRIPVAPMHGDFLLKNALVTDRTHLRLIDWEYASERGSTLYDWWSLSRDMQKANASAASVTRIQALISESLDALRLRRDHFDALGHAMHAIVDLSRVATRGVGPCDLTRGLHALGVTLQRLNPQHA